MKKMYPITKNVLTFVHAKKKMSMGKIKFCGLLFIGGLLGLMSSCLGSDNYEMEEWMLGNAQISALHLSCDSISGLDSVKFTIDQVNSLIYNKDSMPFGTVIDFKVLVDIEFDNPYGVNNFILIEATGDTVQTVTDSVDFSAPVMIIVTAYDGVIKKTYEAKLNVHQVNPDTLVWEKYADILPGKSFQEMKTIQYDDVFYMYVLENSVYQLYRTDIRNMIDWEKLDLSGFPSHAKLSQMTRLADEWAVLSEEGVLYYSDNSRVWTPCDMDLNIKAVLGYLPESKISGRKDVLCCIAETDSVLYYVTIDKQRTITKGNEVAESFPLSGFGQFHYETMYYPRLVIAGGRDSKDMLSDKAFATMDGLTWASLTYPLTTFLSREAAVTFYYDNNFFVIGGIDGSGKALKDVNYSKDQGISWHNTYTVKVYVDETDDVDIVYEYDENADRYYYNDERAYYPMDKEYMARGFSSVFIDKNDFIWLFGGKATQDTNVLNEIWRGRINRLGFDKDR